MGIVLEGLIVPTFILAILYFLLTVLGCKCLIHLHRYTPNLNTRKLFVMSCLLSSFLRFLSFSSMSALNYSKYTVKIDTGGSNGDSGSQISIFFEKASLVLFDLPDFCFISAYVLLLVVWAEAILQSRKHWLSSNTFRKRWLLTYVIFNTVLYTIQVTLYIFLFVPAVDQRILIDLIYLTMGAINMGIQLLWICAYIYLTILVSGFPYNSKAAYLRMISLNRLGGFWTFTRLLWGLGSFTTVFKGWLINGKYNEVFSAATLIAIFTVCEIIPIMYSYRSSSLSCLEESKIDPSSNVVSPMHKDISSAVEAVSTAPLLDHNEQPTEVLSQNIGEYFGASPLQRSLTWGSGYDEEIGTAGRVSFQATTRDSAIEGRRSDVSNVTSDGENQWGSSGFWSGWLGF